MNYKQILGLAGLLWAHAAFALKTEIIAVSEDNQKLAAAYDDHTVRIFSLKDGKLLHKTQPIVNELNSLNFNEKGDLLVGGSYDDVAFVWNAQSGEQLGKIRTTDMVVNAYFSQDNHIVLLLDERGIRVFNTQLKQVASYTASDFKGLSREALQKAILTTPLVKKPKKLGYESVDNGMGYGNYWVRENPRRGLGVWDIDKQTQLGSLPTNTYSYTFSPNQELWEYDNYAMEVWDLQSFTRKQAIVLEDFDVDEINYLSFSNDNQLVAISVRKEDEKAEVIVLNRADNTVKTVIKPASNQVYATKFLNNHTLLLDSSLPIEVWDLKANKKVLNITTNGSEMQLSAEQLKRMTITPYMTEDGFNGLAVNHQGQLAVDKSLLDNEGYPLKHFEYDHDGYVQEVRFSPDGKQVVFANEAVNIFDVETTKLIEKYSINSTVHRVDYSPDGKQLVIASYDGLYVVDLSQLKLEKISAFADDSIYSVLWLDNQTLLVSGDEQLIRYDLNTQEQTVILKNEAWDLAGYFENGKIKKVAVAQYGNNVLLLDEHLKAVKTSPQENAYRVRFDAKGERVIASASHTLSVWDIPTDKSCQQDGFDNGELTGMTFDKKTNIIYTGDAKPIFRFDLHCTQLQNPR